MIITGKKGGYAENAVEIVQMDCQGKTPDCDPGQDYQFDNEDWQLQATWFCYGCGNYIPYTESHTCSGQIYSSNAGEHET